MLRAEDLDCALRPLLGAILADRYEIRRPIAVGGMSTVFAARQIGLERDVAIKVLCPTLARAGGNYAERFEREARSLARLDHPNCLRVLDYGLAEGYLRFLATELIDGVELRSMMKRPMKPRAAVGRIRQILAGLEHAHACGVIHRDLKPENILVSHGPDGREVLKLVDFGIAKLINAPAGSYRTTIGVVFGTPQYMSPEQAAGLDIDHRADLYSAGVLLYAMLAGRVPFDGSDPIVTTRAQIHDPPPPLPATVPRGLAAVVERLLAKAPEDRYASAAEVCAALERAEAGEDEAASETAKATSPGSTRSTGVPARRSRPDRSWLEAGMFALGALLLGWACQAYEPGPGSGSGPALTPASMAEGSGARSNVFQ